MRRTYGPFLALNAVLIVLLAVAPFHPGTGATTLGDLVRSIVTRWIPFALIVATALAVLLARGSGNPRRILARHFWLYLAVPATTALVFFGDKVDQSTLGAPYIALVAAIALGGLRAVWRSRVVRSDIAIGALLGAVTLASALALLPFDRTIQLATHAPCDLHTPASLATEVVDERRQEVLIDPFPNEFVASAEAHDAVGHAVELNS